jgi:hypothetical protein
MDVNFTFQSKIQILVLITIVTKTTTYFLVNIIMKHDTHNTMLIYETDRDQAESTAFQPLDGQVR